MADLTITAANVLAAAGAEIDRTKVYGEAAAAGELVYLKASDSKYWLADCLAADTDEVAGIALSSGAAGQPAAVARSGSVAMGSVFTVGTIYVLSEGGAMAPAADLLSDDFVSVVGVGTSATTIGLKINNSGVQVP